MQLCSPDWPLSVDELGTQCSSQTSSTSEQSDSSVTALLETVTVDLGTLHHVPCVGAMLGLREQGPSLVKQPQCQTIQRAISAITENIHEHCLCAVVLIHGLWLHTSAVENCPQV